MYKNILILITILALFGCEVTPPGTFIPGEEEGATPEVSALFQTVEGGGLVFETNDISYIYPGGYTLWHLADDEAEDFTRREASLSKYSGNQTAGYGFIYCYRDDPVWGRCMLVVLINTEKEYLVGEITGSTFRELVSWKGSHLLTRGYNVNNTIHLTYQNGEYVLSFNGLEEVTFRDEEPPYHTFGKKGYLVVISPLEEFPEVPVKVSFEESGE